MKKTTRKSFSRKAIVAVVSVFLTISLTAVGFASWLISNDASTNGTGNVKASNVSDAILGVTINNAPNLGTINFGPLKDDETGNVRYDKNEAEDFESLKITVTGKINKFATLELMEIKIKVPDSVIAAAGYGLVTGSDTKYEVKSDLPQYITLPAGAADEKGNLIDPSKTVVYQATDTNVFAAGADDSAGFKFDVAFGWGELFKKGNPGKYLDNEIPDTEVDNEGVLVDIAKKENATAAYTTLTAEAKRDLLNAMKKAIAESEAKFTVVVNAQAK